MVNSHCFVPGCNTGYYRKDDKNKKRYSMFSPPRDPDLLAKWKLAIARKDRELMKNDKVCELHFVEDDIERFYITKIADGTIDKLQRGKPVLKCGSVPTQFPNLPWYLTKKEKNRKMPSRNSILNSQISKVTTGDENVASTSTDINDCNVNLNCLQKITFETIMEASNIKPNKWWSISEVGDVITCARWNHDFNVEKSIIINADLQAKVYLREREIVIPDLTKVASIDDVSALLRRVERFNICAGVNKFKDCLVCLLVGKGASGMRKWCGPCRISSKREFNAKRSQNGNTKAEREKRRKMELKNERRKNKRLLNKVHMLRRRLQIYEKICPSLKSEVNKISSMFITTNSAQNSINTTYLEDEDSSDGIDCDILYN